MATYHATIPSDVSAQRVFDAVSAEVTGSMDGICVVVHGDERMGDYFSTAKDEVFKACISPKEIVQKIRDGASIGTLCVNGDKWSVRLSRQFPRWVVDDSTVPCRDFYSVTVTLISADSFSDDVAIDRDYARWLVPLEKPVQAKRVTRIYGATRDVVMGYQIRASLLPLFMGWLGLSERSDIEAYGEVQEKGQLANFSIDLARYGFRGLYSIYPEWPVHGVTNYPNEACSRLCSLIDSNDGRVLASIGRRHCAFRCKDGRSTRTLEGNRFDVYRTKSRRSVTVSFDQYSGEDPPVRSFSGGVRSRLAGLGVKI